MSNIVLRIAETKDIAALESIALAMKTVHEPKYFERCFGEGERTLVLAEEEDGGRPVGYAIINWDPSYIPFKRLRIPEIQDLNVVPDARNQGAGNEIVQWCENRVKSAGHTDVAISVGLYARYGAAQRLYARRGYVPDGAGIAYDDTPVQAGEMRAVDDLLTLKMIKSLL